MLVRKKKDEEQSQAKLVAYTIILYICSFILPFVFVATFQSTVYFSRDYWFFSTPFSAYTTFMGGMLYIAIVFTLYLIFKQIWESVKIKWLTGILLLASIPAFILSLTNYYYLDDSGIHYNSLKGLEETVYSWKDINKVHIVYRNHQGTTSLYQYNFEMESGDKVTIPFDDKLAEYKYKLDAIIKGNKIPVEDNFKHPIVD
ncbi:MAG: hypothetical protein ABGX20_09055 [Bacillus sp. (in: firmicutes)]